MPTLEINGIKVTVEEGKTILDAAREIGVYIPTLCYDKRLRPYGFCRVCTVEDIKQNKLLLACCARVKDGMQILTNTDKVKAEVKKRLQLLLKDHPLDCVVCDKAGECKLQDLAFGYEVFSNPYRDYQSKLNIVKEEFIPYEKLPLIEINNSRCVLCGLCVRICDKVEGVNKLVFVKRGEQAKIVDFNKEVDCQFCFQCIDICPTGALTTKLFKHKVRVWELQKVNTICCFCGVGCKVEVNIKENKVLRVKSVEGNLLCARARFGFKFLDNNQRIKTPLIRENNSLKEISYDEALREISQRISSYKPHQIGIFLSPTLTFEELILFKELFKDNFIVSVPNYVYLPYMHVRKNRSSLEDIKSADFIMVCDYDPQVQHLVQVEILHAVRENKAKLYILNSRNIKLSEIYGLSPSHTLPSTILFKPKTQEKFINGMINYIIQNNLYKPQANNIEGFSKLKSAVSEYPITDKIKEVTSQLLEAKNPKLITGWGVSYVNNYNLIISLYNLALLIGCEDGFYLLSEEINQLGAMQLIPQEKSIYEILDNIKMLYIVGEDLLGRYPGYTQLKEKLEKLEFLVVQDLFLTETAKVCNIFLPLLSFLEKDGHIINTEGKIEKIKKVLDNSWIINNEELLNRLSELLNQKKLKKPINITDYYMQESKELKPSFKPTVSVSEILPDIEKKDEYFYLDVGGLMFHSPRLTEYSDILLSLEKGGFVEINSNKKEFNDKVKIVSDYGELEKIELRRPKYLLEENTAFMPAYLSKNGFLLYPSCQIINNIEWFKIPRIKIVY